METVFKTKFQLEKENKELALYTEYQQMIAVPGRSKVEIAKYLADKYHIATISTVYSIRKRVEKRLSSEGLL